MTHEIDHTHAHTGATFERRPLKTVEVTDVSEQHTGFTPRCSGYSFTIEDKLKVTLAKGVKKMVLLLKLRRFVQSLRHLDRIE